MDNDEAWLSAACLLLHPAKRPILFLLLIIIVVVVVQLVVVIGVVFISAVKFG